MCVFFSVEAVFLKGFSAKLGNKYTLENYNTEKKNCPHIYSGIASTHGEKKIKF